MNSNCANNINVETKRKNQELIERFPFLLPDYGRDDRGRLSPDFDFSFTELDLMPDGWRMVFGEQMCEEIKEALLTSGSSKEEGLAALYDYRILEIKEKYGQLRWYDTGGADEITEKYLKISERVCVECGKPATRQSTHWICPYCDDCGPIYEQYVPIKVENDG